MSLLRLAWSYYCQRIILPMASLGIALGIGVLFTVFGVFNGFLSEMENSIRAVSGDVNLEIPREAAQTESDYRRWFEDVDELATSTPQLQWFGLIGRRGSRAIDDPRTADLSGVMLLGVDPLELPFTATKSGLPPMQVGVPLAQKLGLEIGDAVEIVTHRLSRGQPVPMRQSFEYTANYSTGRFDQDLDRVFVRRSDLAKISGTQPQMSHWILGAADGVSAEQLALALKDRLDRANLNPLDYPHIRTWHAVGGNFLRAAENQKGILTVVFGFIVLVAAYQLIATLLLTVAEKRRDIGILAALGASPWRVSTFFVGLSLVISSIGISLGLLLGWWLTRNLSIVESWLGGGKTIFREEIYKFDHIPVAVDLQMVVTMVGITLLTSTLFSLLPAWRAARTRIITSLQRR
jgi:lipoprotein-releasing system permease protein